MRRDFRMDILKEDVVFLIPDVAVDRVVIPFFFAGLRDVAQQCQPDVVRNTTLIREKSGPKYDCGNAKVCGVLTFSRDKSQIP